MQYAARRPQFILGEDQNWKQRVITQVDSSLNNWVEQIPLHRKFIFHTIP